MEKDANCKSNGWNKMNNSPVYLLQMMMIMTSYYPIVGVVT